MRTALLVCWVVGTVASIVVAANRFDWGGITRDFQRKIAPWRQSGGVIKRTHPIMADSLSYASTPHASAPRFTIVPPDAVPSLVKSRPLSASSGHLIQGPILHRALESTILSTAIAPLAAISTLTPFMSLAESPRPPRMTMRKRVESMEQSAAILQADGMNGATSASRVESMPPSATLSKGAITTSVDASGIAPAALGITAPPALASTAALQDIDPAVLAHTGKNLGGQTVSFVVGGDIGLDARAPASMRLAIARYAGLDPRLDRRSLEQWLTLDREESHSKSNVRITGVVRPAQNGTRVTIDVTDISSIDTPAH